MFTSCLRSDQSYRACVPYCPESKITKLFLAGVGLIVLGIVLGSIYRQRGNFQILMTHEGKAVLGLVITGTILATVFGAILILAQNRNKKRAADSKVNMIVPNPDPAHFAITKPTRKHTFPLINILYLCVGAKYMVAQTLEETQKAELLKIDITDEYPPTEKLAAFQSGTTCRSQLIFEKFLVAAFFENSNQFLAIYNLEDNKNQTTAIPWGVITALHAEKSILARDRVLFLGYGTGSIDFFNFEDMTRFDSYTPFSVDEKEGKKKIISILTAKNCSVNNENYSSLLILGTDKQVFFHDLGSRHTSSITANGVQLAFTDTLSFVTVDQNVAMIWNLNELTCVKTIDFRNKVPSLACVLCTSALAVTGSRDNSGQVLIWNLKEEEQSIAVFDSGEPVQDTQLFGTDIFTISKNKVIQWSFDSLRT